VVLARADAKIIMRCTEGTGSVSWTRLSSA
jgi:hypothetical protein